VKFEKLKAIYIGGRVSSPRYFVDSILFSFFFFNFSICQGSLLLDVIIINSFLKKIKFIHLWKRRKKLRTIFLFILEKFKLYYYNIVIPFESIENFNIYCIHDIRLQILVIVTILLRVLSNRLSVLLEIHIFKVSK